MVKIYENQQRGIEKGGATTQKRTSVDLSLHTMTHHERSAVDVKFDTIESKYCLSGRLYVYYTLYIMVYII